MSRSSHYLATRRFRNVESSADPTFVRTTNTSNYSGNSSTNSSYYQGVRNYPLVSRTESCQSTNRQRTRGREILIPIMARDNSLINSPRRLTTLDAIEVIENLRKNISISGLKNLHSVLETEDLNLREQTS
ncbi:hypothetical protein LOD99_6246 [Oopsacas minuta]|uniref:Uncharacterized protein n=1 Tax=Oopsacas minuta TaxID=111878 RepID=A0AAV7JMN1_9METZ|nr:hypothetical protein LOD99_6246 [Oopsacas minuta]